MDHFLVTILEQLQVSNMNGTRYQKLRVGGNGGGQESTVKGNSLDRRLMRAGDRRLLWAGNQLSGEAGECCDLTPSFLKFFGPLDPNHPSLPQISCPLLPFLVHLRVPGSLPPFLF